jgi:hypothetical protein
MNDKPAFTEDTGCCLTVAVWLIAICLFACFTELGQIANLLEKLTK